MTHKDYEIIAAAVARAAIGQPDRRAVAQELDDAQLVEVHARKVWCEGPGVPEFTVVTCRMVGMVGSDLVVLGDAA